MVLVTLPSTISHSNVSKKRKMTPLMRPSGVRAMTRRPNCSSCLLLNGIRLRFLDGAGIGRSTEESEDIGTGENVERYKQIEVGSRYEVENEGMDDLRQL